MMMATARIALAFLIAKTAMVPAGELRVFPPEVHLSPVSLQQGIVVQWAAEDDSTQDVTMDSSFEFQPAGVAEIDEGIVSPLGDGQTSLRVQFGDAVASISIHVSGHGVSTPVGFERDVIPVLTRAGCNAGTCHGASRGQDGFRLSLFGFDPAGDHFRLTRELAARRIHLAVPAESLMLLKATGAVPHTGGRRVEPGSRHYEILRRWLEEGAVFDTERPVVARLSVYPPESTLMGQGTCQRLVVVATYGDGTQRDVTDLAVILSNDESVAAWDGSRQLIARGRGESFVTARFGAHTVGVPVIVVDPSQPEPPAIAAEQVIDQLVLTKLRKLRIPPGPLCSDEEFLRRSTVDTLGLLPTRADYDAFVSDGAPDKRARWIDHLLARPEFTALWASQWADLLMIREKVNLVSRKAAVLYLEWLQQQFAEGVPLDAITRKLLTSDGNTFEYPAATFFVVEPNRLKLAENVAQLFLGIRIQCAQCHHHPFDRWTMDDYYGFADFFAGVRRRPHEDYRQWIVWSAGGETRHPVTKELVTARFLGGPAPETPGRDRRLPLADWITSPENPYFSRSLANRIWAHYLGHGVVDPVDDVRISNPPVNGPLLDYLAERLSATQYDIRPLAREILNSQTYQRATARPGELADERNFSHAIFRRIPATSLLDCISQVTESPEKFRGLPLGSRAVDAVDHVPESYFLTTFGRASRTSVCACETQMDPTLSQALHLINGSTLHTKIRRGGVVTSCLHQGLTPEEVIQELYIRCLTRMPRPEETRSLLQEVSETESPAEGLDDVFWSLLNSREFVFNH